MMDNVFSPYEIIGNKMETKRFLPPIVEEKAVEPLFVVQNEILNADPR